VKARLPCEMSRQSLKDRDRLQLLKVIFDKSNILTPINVWR
jgi:hypothetical protein